MAEVFAEQIFVIGRSKTANFAEFISWWKGLKNMNFKGKSKKTLWSLFTDGVQLPQGYRATTRNNYKGDNSKVIHIKGTCFIKTEVYLN